METMTATATDKRIDDLRSEMQQGFTNSDRRIDDLRSEVHQGFINADKRVDDLRSELHGGFARVDADLRELGSGIASMQRLMVGFFATTLGSIVAGVVIMFLSHS